MFIFLDCNQVRIPWFREFPLRFASVLLAQRNVSGNKNAFLAFISSDVERSGMAVWELDHLLLVCLAAAED
jgi:hypothetical protein